MALIALLPAIELPSAEAALTKNTLITSDEINPHVPISGPRLAPLNERRVVLSELQDVVAKIAMQQRMCAKMNEQGGDSAVKLASLDALSFTDFRTAYMRALSTISDPDGAGMSEDELRETLAKLKNFSDLITLDIEKCRALGE